MISVKLLSLKIAAQFAVILLPLVALLLYATGAESRRAAVMSEELVAHAAVIVARDRYATFVNGVADSVDTGKLSRRARAALSSVLADVAELQSLSAGATARYDELAGVLRAIDEVVEADATVQALTGVRKPIHAARQRFDGLAQLHQTRLDLAVQDAIAGARQSRVVVLVLSVLLLLLASAFVVQFIRRLSRPLRHAVEVADRIAAGQALGSIQIDAQHDLGNLLRSLQGMQARLQSYEAAVEQHRRGLEAKLVELAQSQRMLAQAQSAAKLGSWQWDGAKPGPACSDELLRIAALELGGATPSLRRFLRRLPSAGKKLLVEQFRTAAERSTEIILELPMPGPPGALKVVSHRMAALHDSEGRWLGLSGFAQDITERKRTEDQMRRLAMYDSLTGLANRQHFSEHLNHAVARAKRQGCGFAVIFIDLDRFKRINDTLGHTVGDELLRSAATRLQGCMRESDSIARLQPETPTENMVARLGGDEFVVLLRDLLTPRDAVVVASRIIKALAAPFTIDTHELVVTASLGIAMYPSDGADSESLITHADAAMYAAKKRGRNSFQFYSKDMNSAALDKLTLEAQLRQAIEGGQLVLYYQPKIEVSTGAIVGVEALVRWQHPQLGLVMPANFIPLAEEAGLIVELGDAVLEMGCRQARQWSDAGLPEVSVSINLASPSFRKAGLVAQIAELIERHALRPRQLQIEATESMLMDSVGTTMDTLLQLRKLGVQLSIDDFGTGYSSLTYLRRFPIDEIKIDRSFVSEMAHNSDDAAIVTAIVSLGRNMHRRIVAEGVETLAQVRALRRIGCTVLQGYLFSKPVPADEMTELLRRESPFAWVKEESGHAEVA